MQIASGYRGISRPTKRGDVTYLPDQDRIITTGAEDAEKSWMLWPDPWPPRSPPAGVEGISRLPFRHAIEGVDVVSEVLLEG